MALSHRLLNHARHPSAPRNRQQAAGLAMFIAAMRRTSSQILPVLSSFPSLFRLQKWTELNHPSAGGRQGSGVLPCMR